MKKNNLILIMINVLLFAGCKTVDLEKTSIPVSVGDTSLN